MNEDVFHGEIADHYREGDVIYHVLKDDVIIYDLDAAKQFLSERLSFANGKDYAMIFNCNNMKTANMEAQKFDATDEALQGLTMMAVIVQSKIQQVLGNIYMMMQKPKVQTKLFTNKEDAKKWVEKQKHSLAA